MKRKIYACILTAALLAAPCEAVLAEEAVTLDTEAAGETSEETAADETAETAFDEEAAEAEDTAETDEASSSEETAEETDDAAAGESSAAASSDTQTLDACYSLAINAINAEDYEAAKDYLSVCFGYCDPEENPYIYADLLLKQACINTIEEKTDLALRNLDAAIRIQPDLADAYMVRADVYVAQGNVDKAVADLETYIELTEDTSMYATVAQLQEANGDMEAAQQAYDKYAAGVGSESEETGFQAGLYRMQNGKYTEAIKAFEAYTDNETFAAGAWYNIGVCKMDMGDFAGAAEAFDACEEKGGTFEGLYYNRGVCRLMIEEWAKSAEDFATSIEKEPYTADATYNLAICQMQLEEYEKAIGTFTSYIGDGKAPEAEEDAENADASEEEAEAESAEETEAESTEEAEAEPDEEADAEPAEELEAGTDEEPAEEAEAEPSVETETAAAVPNGNYGAYYYRAVCEGAIGDLVAALADYTVCIDNGYELTQSYYQRAQVYAALGDTENQNKDLTESLKYTE